MEKKWPKERIKKEIMEWIFCFIVAYIIYLLLNYFVGTVSGVKQISMKPTANEGERLLIQRTVLTKKNINRGDIVTFIAPSLNVGKTTIEEDSIIEGIDAIANYDEHLGIESFTFNFMSIGKKSYIKRVIGIAGDHIYIALDGMVYRNDELIVEEYLKDGTTNRNGAYIDVIVPDNAVFVMGDNRLHSMDSRCFGCVPIDQIDGYVITRVWPFNKMGSLK